MAAACDTAHRIVHGEDCGHRHAVKPQPPRGFGLALVPVVGADADGGAERPGDEQPVDQRLLPGLLPAAVEGHARLRRAARQLLWWPVAGFSVICYTRAIHIV